MPQAQEFFCSLGESTVLRSSDCLEKHKLVDEIQATVKTLLMEQRLLLKVGSLVDATLITAPKSTKKKYKPRGPEMHQIKKKKISSTFA